MFKPGDKVLVLFPNTRTSTCRPDTMVHMTVESKVGEVDYIVIKTPGRRKSRQLCHVNMLKEYIERNQNGYSVTPVCSVGPNANRWYIMTLLTQDKGAEINNQNVHAAMVSSKEYQCEIAKFRCACSSWMKN